MRTDSRNNQPAAAGADDRKSVERFAGGDERGFIELVERYKDRIHQFICWHMDNCREAEDITQEVFIQMFKSIKSFRGDSSFGTWLYSLTRNVCSYYRRKHPGDPAERVRSLDDPDKFLEIPDRGPAQEAVSEKAGTLELLRSAIDRLPPIYRTVILLRDWENLSYEEIAAVLDIPVGTVRSRLHNATVLLIKEFEPVISP